MGILLLIWAGMGLLIGLITYAAGIYPPLWKGKWKLSWYTALLIGAIVSVGGGWVGLFLFGRLFSIVMALWITPAISVIPWGITRMKARKPFIQLK